MGRLIDLEVEVNSVRLRVRKHGSRGPALMVLHGLGDSAKSWDRVAEALSERSRVFVPDLRGHGASARSSDYAYDLLRDDVEALARSLELVRFGLIGHSVGGNLAWLVAKKRPELVERLVLIEAAAPHRTRFSSGPLPQARHLMTYAEPEEYARFLGLSAADVADDLVRRADGRWEPAFDPGLFPGLAAGYREPDAFWAGAARVTMPLLCIRGDQSFINPAFAEEFLEHVKHGQMLVLEGADHFMNRKQPLQLAEALNGFLT